MTTLGIVGGLGGFSASLIAVILLPSFGGGLLGMFSLLIREE